MLEQEQEAGVAMVHAIPELKVPPVACLVSLQLQPPGECVRGGLPGQAGPDPPRGRQEARAARGPRPDTHSHH